MPLRPQIGFKSHQAANVVPDVIPDFTQKLAFRPNFPGGFANININPAPPSGIPELSGSAQFGSFQADLVWTYAGSQGAGFGFKLYVSSGGPYTLIADTTSYSFSWDSGGVSGSYNFQVFPYNLLGEGTGSNIVNVDLPGESNPQSLLLEDGTEILLEDGTELLLEA